MEHKTRNDIKELFKTMATLSGYVGGRCQDWINTFDMPKTEEQKLTLIAATTSGTSVLKFLITAISIHSAKVASINNSTASWVQVLLPIKKKLARIGGGSMRGFSRSANAACYDLSEIWKSVEADKTISKDRLERVRNFFNELCDIFSGAPKKINVQKRTRKTN